MQLTVNEYISKSNQNLVQYLLCQAVGHTASLHFRALVVYLMASTSKVQALTFRFSPRLHQWVSGICPVPLLGTKCNK